MRRSTAADASPQSRGRSSSRQDPVGGRRGGVEQARGEVIAKTGAAHGAPKRVPARASPGSGR